MTGPDERAFYAEGVEVCHEPMKWLDGPLTPEEARVIIDAGYDPERILAYLFGEADD